MPICFVDACCIYKFREASETSDKTRVFGRKIHWFSGPKTWLIFQVSDQLKWSFLEGFNWSVDFGILVRFNFSQVFWTKILDPSLKLLRFLTYEEILGLTIGHCFSPLQPLVFNLKIEKKSIPVRLRCAWAVVRNLHPLGRVCVGPVGPGQGPKRWVWGKAGSFGKDFFVVRMFFFVGKGGESLLTTPVCFGISTLLSELAAIYPNFPWKWNINYS